MLISQHKTATLYDCRNYDIRKQPQARSKLGKDESPPQPLVIVNPPTDYNSACGRFITRRFRFKVLRYLEETVCSMQWNKYPTYNPIDIIYLLTPHLTNIIKKLKFKHFWYDIRRIKKHFMRIGKQSITHSSSFGKIQKPVSKPDLKFHVFLNRLVYCWTNKALTPRW